MIQKKDLLDLIQDLGHRAEMQQEIKSGKEATVYKILLDGVSVALKVYVVPENNDFKNNQKYLENKFYKTKSHERAVEKKSKFGKQLQFTNWVTSEYHLMESLYESGASIPEPIMQLENAIVMELIGDDTQVAPRLQDADMDKYTKLEIQKIFDTVLDTVRLTLSLGFVHGDLSSYNILLWKDKPYVIDFPQAVDVITNPNAITLLTRDLTILCKFFSRYIEVNQNSLLQEFIKVITSQTTSITPE
jgi:RIO kinase 1